ncbi:MAG: hypothetical protein QJR03_10390 [Sphaerobacter sp.]|nr:hypothetical protein [Sphaerobacter sp.]
MPTLDLVAILSLLMVLVSIRTLVTTVRQRATLFDAAFTRADRQQLAEVAVFLLLPISVLLHEVGHAVAVRAFGGEITGFGYYFFFGYVAHRGFYTAADLFWIALAGNLVSVVLGLAAIALVVLRPLRPPVNYLLLMFGAIDLANSLVFYPLLDFAGNLVGDWSQIYTRDTPVLSGVTGVIHAGLLLAAVVAWRSDRVRRLYAARTGISPQAVRRVTRRQVANELLAAGEQLAGAWRHPLRVVADAQGEAVGVRLQWISGGYGRVVAAYALVDDWRRLELYGGLHALDGGTPHQQPLGVIEGIPEPPELTRVLAHALDAVDAWERPLARLG